MGVVRTERRVLKLDKAGNAFEIEVRGASKFVAQAAEVDGKAYGSGEITFTRTLDNINFVAFQGGLQLTADGITTEKDIHGVVAVRAEVTAAGTSGAEVAVTMSAWSEQ